jgi:hypothetical protein
MFDTRENSKQQRLSSIDDQHNHHIIVENNEESVWISPTSRKSAVKKQTMFRRVLALPLLIILLAGQVIFFALIRSNIMALVQRDGGDTSKSLPSTVAGVDHAHAHATNTTGSQPQRRLAVASFLDGPSHLYGTYSIVQQIQRTGMTVPYIVAISDDFSKSHPAEFKVLLDMLGGEQIRVSRSKEIHFQRDQGPESVEGNIQQTVALSSRRYV